MEDPPANTHPEIPEMSDEDIQQVTLILAAVDQTDETREVLSTLQKREGPATEMSVDMWRRLIAALPLEDQARVAGVNNFLRDLVTRMALETQTGGPGQEFVRTIYTQSELDASLAENQPLIFTPGEGSDLSIPRASASGQPVILHGPHPLTKVTGGSVQAKGGATITTVEGGRVDVEGDAKVITAAGGGVFLFDQASVETVTGSGHVLAAGNAKIKKVEGGTANATDNVTITSVTGGDVVAQNQATVTDVSGGIVDAYGDATVTCSAGGTVNVYDNTVTVHNNRGTVNYLW
ncbi:MAG: hypothetical protein H0T78_02445 [Longispora sp.]|nr:hypothetical protein [Longispora sp. (in: high G+C Gram-positive bacteria)]